MAATTSFNKTFEKQVNADMAGEDLHDQKQPCSPLSEAEDYDIHEKKDHPPRFSTLFATPIKAAPVPMPAPAPAREFESYPEPKRRSGIFLPTPLFVTFAVLFLFESTVLFAYTVIGLYNNLPSRLVPGGDAVVGCDYAQHQAPINISPNFVMPQAAQAIITETVTVSTTEAVSSTVSTTTSTSASSTSVSSTTASAGESSQAAGAIASMLLGLHSTQTSSQITTSTSESSRVTVVTETPTRSTVNVVTYLTVNPEGSTLPVRPTVTSTLVVSDPASASSSAIAQRSVEAALASISESTEVLAIPTESSLLSSSTTPSITTAVSLTTPSTSIAPTTTSTASAQNRLCIIGPGGMMPAGCFGNPA